MEFASHKIPQVDANRLFVAGHSSAATLALLAAAHEPRLKGCVAYAPTPDVAVRQQDALSAADAERVFPGVRHFAKQSSPASHVKRVSCPVFLFHAADDNNAPVGESRKFVGQLKAEGKSVEYVEVPAGNHYDSMIEQGIPAAVPWLKKLAEAIPSTDRSSPAVAQGGSATAASRSTPTVPPISNPTANAGTLLQSSGRAVTLKYRKFSGMGDAFTSARRALANVAWADPNDIEIDEAANEIRIGQLGGFAKTQDAQTALIAAGFDLLPGVSVGPKKMMVANPNQNPTTTPSLGIVTPNPDNAVKAAAERAKSAAASIPKPGLPKPAETATSRRVVTFKYERFTGKGSSANAVRLALKNIAWANQDDIEFDTSKKEIRVGQSSNSDEFEPARKALQNAGFQLAPGVSTSTRRK